MILFLFMFHNFHQGDPGEGMNTNKTCCHNIRPDLELKYQQMPDEVAKRSIGFTRTKLAVSSRGTAVLFAIGRYVCKPSRAAVSQN